MSAERPPHLRKAGQSVRPKPKPSLTLVQSTTPLPSSSEMSQEIKEMLHKMSEKKRRVGPDSDTPDAA
jgi:predicted RNA methylase